MLGAYSQPDGWYIVGNTAYHERRFAPPDDNIYLVDIAWYSHNPKGRSPKGEWSWTAFSNAIDLAVLAPKEG